MAIQLWRRLRSRFLALGWGIRLATGDLLAWMGIQASERGLTEDEEEYLRRIFGHTIDYGKVRIHVRSAGSKTKHDAVCVVGNTVYMASSNFGVRRERNKLKASGEFAALAAGMVRVWQNQHLSHGRVPVEDGSSGQNLSRTWELCVPSTRWHGLTLEQQAKFIRDAVHARAFEGQPFRWPAGESEASQRDQISYTAYLYHALAQIRSAVEVL